MKRYWNEEELMEHFILLPNELHLVRGNKTEANRLGFAKDRNISNVTRHIFYWSILAIFIEWLAIKTEFMRYQSWWNMGWSYLADWILYIIFYAHYKWRENESQSN